MWYKVLSKHVKKNSSFVENVLLGFIPDDTLKKKGSAPEFGTTILSSSFINLWRGQNSVEFRKLTYINVIKLYLRMFYV